MTCLIPSGALQKHPNIHISLSLPVEAGSRCHPDSGCPGISGSSFFSFLNMRLQEVFAATMGQTHIYINSQDMVMLITEAQAHKCVHVLSVFLGVVHMCL